MRIIVIIFCSLLAIPHSIAQDFITDDQVAQTAVAVDGEMKVLYFTASWCGPCKRMKPAISKMANNPDAPGTIYKMDIDNNITDDIVGIPGVPTFVFLKNGTEIGRHTGAIPDVQMEALFDKHAALPPSTQLLNYQPVPSNLSVVAGSHPQLTKANLKKLWHSNDNLTKMSISIFNNLNETKDLTAGLVLTKRAIEIKETVELHMLQSNFLKRMGETQGAIAAAQKARSLAKSKKGDTSRIDQYINQLQG